MSTSDQRSRARWPLLRTVLILGGLFWGGHSAHGAEPSAIRWHRNLPEASAAAREANKPMVLDFWADWCAPCRVMEKEVYPDAGVTAAAPKFVFVKIDFDRQEDLARKYGVEALPVLIITNSYGLEIFRFRGLIHARDLAAVLQALPEDVAELNRLGQILSEDKNNFEALQGLGKELRTASLFRASNEYYHKALGRPEAKKDLRQREMILMEMGLNYLELKESKAAIETFEKCRKEFPQSPRQPHFRLSLAEAYALGQKKDKARALLNGLVISTAAPEIARKARELLRELQQLAPAAHSLP